MYKTVRTNLFMLIYSTISKNNLIPKLIIACLIIVILNIKTAEVSKTAISLFKQQILIQNEKKEYITDLAMQFFIFISIHYTFSSIIKAIKANMKITIAKIAMQDAETEILNMEYNTYHAHGLGRIQDIISRSSWSLADATIMFTISMPEALVSIVYQTYKLWKYLRPSDRLWYYGLTGTSFLFVFLINIFIYRGERVCKNLYRITMNYLMNTLTHFDAVKAFNNEKKEVNRYGKELAVFEKQTIHFYRYKEFIELLQKIAVLVPHGFAIICTVRNNGKTIDFKDIEMYNQTFISFKTAFILLRDYLFNMSKRVSDLETRLVYKVKDESNSLTINKFTDCVEFKNVNLMVSNKLINNGISLKINKGDIIAITGSNGSGKSVFLKTILRFHESTPGITVDGLKIENIKDSSMRDLISYVPQDPHIFNETILYNLGYSQDKDNEEEIYRLCKLYGYHDFFMNFPNGYLTQAGEAGKNLSGGQKQRINFMRAIIKNAPIIMLDEPTANMDKFAEIELIQSLFEHCKDKTILIIIHNISLLSYFKKILFFKKSGVTEYKSYDDFMQNK